MDSESKGSSRLGSGSNVVISHVVVGPVESSALPVHCEKFSLCMR